MSINNRFGMGAVMKADGPNPITPGNLMLDTVPSWFDNQKLIHPANYTALLQAFKGWVYICSSKNSVAFGAVPLKLYVTKESVKQKVFTRTKQVSRTTRKYMEAPFHANIANLRCVRKSEEILEVPDHPLLDMLYKVNSFMNRFDLFELSNLFLELVGNTYWYVVKNKLGVPAEIWLMQPDRVKIVPSREEWIKGYVYTTLDGRDIPFMPDEVIHFRFPNPHSQYYGWSPLQSMADAYNTNEAYNQFEQHLLKNNAVPPIALIAPKDSVIPEAQFKNIIARWNATYGGVYNAGKAAWLDAGFDVKPLAASPKEMAFAVGRRWMMQEICAAYGVPLSKVSVENVNRANAESGDYQYMVDTIRPRCTRFEEKLNETLIPMVDENLFLMFDNPVPDDATYALKERESNLKSYLTSVNEERAKVGMEAAPWGDVPITPMTVGPFGAKPVGGMGPDGNPIPGNTPGSNVGDMAGGVPINPEEDIPLDEGGVNASKELEDMLVGYLANQVVTEISQKRRKFDFS